MKYLLDVSSLIALGIVRHEFHGRIVAWLDSQRGSSFLTCSITELGFVRIVAQQPIYGYTVSQARAVLLELKKDATFRFEFIPDKNDVSHLPGWVRTARQTTDGHLLELANAHAAMLATFDDGIPGAYGIP
jgi:predicted nucleic acid-binding protein